MHCIASHCIRLRHRLTRENLLYKLSHFVHFLLVAKKAILILCLFVTPVSQSVGVAQGMCNCRSVATSEAWLWPAGVHRLQMLQSYWISDGTMRPHAVRRALCWRRACHAQIRCLPSNVFFKWSSKHGLQGNTTFSRFSTILLVSPQTYMLYARLAYTMRPQKW